MAILLDDVENDVRGSGYWIPEPCAIFARGTAYGVLSRAMRRYVAGEISGRSFLIAGHRGAGKTTLVERVVRDVRLDMIEAFRLGSDGAPSRPLLVKLYGPALREEGAKSPARALDAASPPGEPMASIVAAAIRASRGDPPGATVAPPPPEPTGAAHKTLVQVGIALYRALAEEVAFRVRLHARNAHDLRPGDQLEIAAQLNFELDRPADAATLRQVWNRLGRLEDGILWPSGFDISGTTPRPRDQGMREIVAIATAAQAFQVCTGAVTYSRTEKNSADASSEASSGGALNIKQTVNRIGGILLGAGAGAVAPAFGAKPVAAVAIAIAVGVLGLATLSWTDKRSQRRNQVLDYTFIRDNSVETLDRDLPMVIRRIKAAGLTPVFVIDELDKMDDPISTISEIIGRLKHIVTDFGFFCFLADRETFEKITLTVRSEAYPVEHTYFSDRLLIAYSPRDLLEYLRRVLRAGSAADGLDRDVIALEMLLHARPNFVEVTRRLARAVSDNKEVGAPATPRGRLRQQIAASLQLAIDATMQGPDLGDRIRNDPGFLQFAIDTLYWPVSAWEEGDETFTFTVESLKDYLAKRLDSRTAAANSAPAGGLVPPPPADAPEPVEEKDLRVLHEQLTALMEMLSKFNRLREALVKDGYWADASPVAMVPTLPGGEKGLAGFVDTGCYRWLYDVDGRRADEAPTPLNPDNLTGAQTRKIAAAAGTAKAFTDLLAAVGVSLDQISDAGLLPATVSSAALNGALDRLNAALERNR